MGLLSSGKFNGLGGPTDFLCYIQKPIAGDSLTSNSHICRKGGKVRMCSVALIF